MTVRRKLRNIETRLKDVESDANLMKTGFSIYQGHNWFKKLPVFWRLLLVGISGGSLVGAVTLGILVWQSLLMKEQNEKLVEEIELQSQTYVNARRTDLIELMSSKNSNIKQSAFIEFFSNLDFYDNAYLHLDSLHLKNVYWSNFSYPNIKIDYLMIENCVLDNVLITKDLIGERKNLILISNIIKNSKILANSNNLQFRWNVSINNEIEFWDDGFGENTQVYGVPRFLNDFGRRDFNRPWNLFINDSIKSGFNLWLRLKNQAFLNCKFANNSMQNYISESVFINCPDTVINHTKGVTTNIVLKNYLIKECLETFTSGNEKPLYASGEYCFYKMVSKNDADSTVVFLPSLSSRLNYDLDALNALCN